MRETLLGIGLWLATVFRAAPWYASFDTCLVLLTAISTPLQTYGVKVLIDGLTAGPQRDVTNGLILVAVGLAVSFLGLAGNIAMRATLTDRVLAYIQGDLLRIVTTIPGISHHERPDMANLISELQENSRSMGNSSRHMLSLGMVMVNISAVLLLLAQVHPLLLFLPILGIARVWAGARAARMVHVVRRATAGHRRQAAQLSDFIQSAQNSLEMRAFVLGPLLLERIDRVTLHRCRAHEKVGRRAALLEGSVRAGYGLAYGLAVAWVIALARQGRVAPGDIALVVLLAPQVDRAAAGVSDAVRKVIDMSELFGHYRALKNYSRQFAWQEGKKSPPKRLEFGIRLKNVSFSYPGMDVKSLSNVDLTLPAGKTVALVGENGAGKSTLVKLLARLYDPTEGQILLDGTDLRNMRVELLRDRISAGFQDFVKFEFKARETIGVGDLDSMKDDELLQQAADRGDASTVLMSLPHGLDTQLGARFSGGSELSGGQWQRMALARAFVREKPLLLLLDEPTAALDPEAEHMLFERFAAGSDTVASETGGITILVSHRFSTTRMADLVIVIEGGKVIEVGKHDDLMCRGGRYAELFAMQAKAYQ